MSIEIRKVTELNKENAERVIDWMYNWWGEAEGYTKEELECWLNHSMQGNRLPMTIGMFEGEELIGMYQFIYDDFFIRPDLYPWLANVYIDEKHRGKGYSKVLLNSVKENFSKYLDFKELFLYTAHENLYERYGWEYVEDLMKLKSDNNKVEKLYKLNK